MTTVTLPHEWRPRDYQMPAWKALERGVRRALLFWHRRAGKDDVCLHWAAVSAMQKPATYWHMLPMYEQARKSVWDAVNPRTGKRRIDEAFPAAIRKRKVEQSMMIEFVNGATWQLVGSDNFDALVGSPPYGIVASEYALSDPSAWAYLRPILRENGGWFVAITTPRGKNHAFTMMEAHTDDSDWYVETLGADQTGVFTQSDLDAELQDYIAENGPDDGQALFNQEYLCSFDAALVGAYYTGQIQKVRSQGRIVDDLSYQPTKLAYAAWDIGIADKTAIWVWQHHGDKIAVIDYLEGNNMRLEEWAAKIRQTGYQIACHYLPHDAKQRELTSPHTRIGMLQELGLPCEIVDNVTIKDGINAVHAVFPRCYFNREKTANGIEALAAYRRRFNKALHQYEDDPVHDWASHGADAFRYMALSAHKTQPATMADTAPIAYKRRSIA